MTDLLAQIRDSLEIIGAPELAEDVDQINDDLEAEGEKEPPKKDTRLPEELHLQPNKDIPEKLYAQIDETYELAADVRELAALAYNFTANASHSSSRIMERQVDMAVTIQTILSEVTRKYQPKTRAAVQKSLKKAKKDLQLMRDTIASALNKVDTSRKVDSPHTIREEGSPTVDVEEYEEYNDEIEEEELHEEADAELTASIELTVKLPAITITALDTSQGMGKHRQKRFIRELKRPRAKKVYRYRVCVRPEWHRSVQGKYRWRTKCIRTDATGSSTVKLIYLGFDRAKRPTRIKVEGKNVPVVDTSRYEKLLKELREKNQKGKPKVKPPKGKVPPGKELKPADEPKKIKTPPKGKKILDTSPEELEEGPKKPKKSKKPKKKRRKSKPRKSNAAKARANPDREPTPNAEIESEKVGKIARRSWLKDSVMEVSDVISRHPATLQAAAVGIGVAASLWHIKTKGTFPPDYIGHAQNAAKGIGIAASLKSPDPLRVADHVFATPTSYIQTMLNDQINQTFGVKYVSHNPTPLTIVQTLDNIDSAVSPANIPYRVRGKAAAMVRSLDPDNPPALEDIQELERMQRTGKMDEVASLQKRVDAEKDPDKRKALETELEEKENDIELVKKRIAHKLTDWKLEKFDKFGYQQRQKRLQRRKKALKGYMLDIERKLLETPSSSKERRERLEEQKRLAVRQLNSPPHSEV